MTAASEILRLASVQLQDVEAVRWSVPELADWLNDGIKAVVLAKPNATARTRILRLAPGTLQRYTRSLPGTGGGDENGGEDGSADGTRLANALALLDVVRNLKTALVGGRAIKVTNRALLDAADPHWHDAARTKPTREVRQYTFDEENPLEFYVWPPNDGTGIVEVVVSESPAPVRPLPGQQPTSLAAWAVETGLPSIYDPPLLDYVLYRAQLKDDVGANAGRAMTHYQTFASALGIRVQVEGGLSPNRRRAGQ